MKSEEGVQTSVCSIVFLDIPQFLQQPGEVQFSWRIELSMLLDRCLKGMEPGRRIIDDTSNGAVLAFLHSPEDALSFIRQLSDELPKLQNFALRVGAHLGQLSVVQGPSGHPGIAGDGINAAQRVMRFAGINEVLASRAFQEEIARLMPGNADLFSPYGKQTGKHGREHDLFRMGRQSALLVPAIPSEPPTTPSAPSAPSASPLAPSESPAATSASPESPEPPAPLEQDARDAGIMPPATQAPGFGLKVAIGAFLIVAAGLWLWVAPGSPDRGQTPPVAADSAGQDAPVPDAAPGVDDSPPVAQREQASPAIQEEQRLTVAAPSGKVAPAKKGARDGSDRCPNCSCTDLMTKLSLGSALNETERRYLTERCKK